jgi:hypothetical protein
MVKARHDYRKQAVLMPIVIMSSDEYGAEEFPCVTLDEAADTVRRLAIKAYEELMSGDGVERRLSIAPDDGLEIPSNG